MSHPITNNIRETEEIKKIISDLRDLKKASEKSVAYSSENINSDERIRIRRKKLEELKKLKSFLEALQKTLKNKAELKDILPVKSLNTDTIQTYDNQISKMIQELKDIIQVSDYHTIKFNTFIKDKTNRLMLTNLLTNPSLLKAGAENMEIKKKKAPTSLNLNTQNQESLEQEEQTDSDKQEEKETVYDLSFLDKKEKNADTEKKLTSEIFTEETEQESLVEKNPTQSKAGPGQSYYYPTTINPVISAKNKVNLLDDTKNPEKNSKKDNIQVVESKEENSSVNAAAFDLNLSDTGENSSDFILFINIAFLYQLNFNMFAPYILAVSHTFIQQQHDRFVALQEENVRMHRDNLIANIAQCLMHAISSDYKNAAIDDDCDFILSLETEMLEYLVSFKNSPQEMRENVKELRYNMQSETAVETLKPQHPSLKTKENFLQTGGIFSSTYCCSYFSFFHNQGHKENYSVVQYSSLHILAE